MQYAKDIFLFKYLLKKLLQVVASHDPKAYCYTSKLRLQQPKVEMIEDLKEIMKELLLNFERKTGHKPFQIIFYRYFIYFTI